MAAFVVFGSSLPSSTKTTFKKPLSKSKRSGSASAKRERERERLMNGNRNVRTNNLI